MTLLSTRAKEAIKTGLAMAIAYGIALQMDWDKPYWAGFAVAMISLSTAGQSLNKGALRMLGTMVAVTVSLTFMALFPQERWAFMAIVSIYVGFCTYMMTGKTLQYFWQVSAFVCLVVAADSGAAASSAFDIAVERAQETGLGILVYALIGTFLWPRTGVGALEQASRELAATQRRIFGAYRRLLSGQETAVSSHELRMREVQLVAQVAQLLNGAQTESYQVWELRRQWRRHVELSEMLGTTLERWRESFPELSQMDLGAILPDLQAMLAELEWRFEAVEGMLAGRAPDSDPGTISLAVDRAALRDLSHFQKAAVALTKTQLDQLERLSRAHFACIRDLKGFGPAAAIAPARASVRGGFDPDRLMAAVRVVATLWIAFLLWVYVDPPGHASFVSIAPTFALVVASMPQVPAVSLLLPFAGGSALAGLLYVFVMPELSGYGGLGAMIFLATSTIYYLFAEPRQMLAKFGAIVHGAVVRAILKCLGLPTAAPVIHPARGPPELF